MRRVGIDLGLRSAHRAAVYDGATPLGRPFSVARSKAGMDALDQRATTGAAGRCEVLMEPTGLVWLYVAAELSRRGHRIFVPKPQKTRALRKFYSTYAKSDGVDAKAHALIRHVDPDGVYELAVPTAAQTSLKLLVKQRARLMSDVAASKKRISGWLVLANPHLMEALGRQPFSQVGTAFLRRFVDPFKVTRRGKAELKRFWRRQSLGRFNEDQFEAVYQACETTCDMYRALRDANQLSFDYDAMSRLVRQELERIEFCEGQVADLDKEIVTLYSAVDPERTLVEQVPGVGETVAATIEAFVGDVDRFKNIDAFAANTGIVPRTHHTGGRHKNGQRITKGGQPVLKQHLYIAGDVARRKDPELAATYERALACGKHHTSAVVIVAHKLVRKIYAILKLRAKRQRAQAAGMEISALPVVAYDYRDPDTGKPISRQEARAIIDERFPSKANKAKAKRAARRTSPQSGSPKDATKGIAVAPKPSLPDSAICEKSVDNLVDNLANILSRN